MKKVAILMCLLAICLTGCFETQSAWVYGNPESDGMIGARLGTEVVQNLEVGLSTQLDPYDDSDSATYGAYSLLHFPMGAVSPYVGAQANIGQGTWDIADTIEPVGGVVLWDVLFAEYQRKTTSGEDDKVLFGLRFRF